jgi:hypothetical protein
MVQLPERVHAYMVGSNPVALAEDKDYTIILDAAAAKSAASASFAVRHTSNRFIAVSEVGDALGTRIAPAAAPGAYLAFMAPGAVPGQGDAERMRVGGQVVTVSADLEVTSTAHVMQDMIVSGELNASTYLNLVDDFASTATLRPPTANALANAYISLSNLIRDRFSPYDPGASNAGYLSNVNLSVLDPLQTGPVVCASLFVPAGGCVYAHAYCNLVDSYVSTSTSMPCTARALSAAYAQLSNYVTLQLRSAVVQGLASSLTSASNSNLNSSYLGSLAADVWLQSSDSRNRLLFESASGRAVFAAEGGFRWVTDSLDAQSEAMRLGDVLEVSRPMRVTSAVQLTGTCTVDGSLNVSGGYLGLPQASVVAPGIVQLTDTLPQADDAADAAATGSLVRQVADHMHAEVDTVRGLLAESIYSMYLASNMASAASNQAYEYTLTRSYTSNVMTTGLHLSSSAADVDGGVQLRLTNDAGSSMLVGLHSSSAQTPSSAFMATVNGGPLLLGAESYEDSNAVCMLSVGSTVSIIPGRASGLQELPPNNMSSNVIHTADGNVVTVSASSVFVTDAVWSQPYQGVVAAGEGDEMAWLSAAGSYDVSTGQPCSQTRTPARLAGNVTADIMGEWLQVSFTLPVFASKVYLKTTYPGYAPDGFILLGSEPGSPEWSILSETSTTAGQRATMLAGGTYSVNSTKAFEAFRLVVTQVTIQPSFAFADLAHVDVFKVIGSTQAFTPDAVFTVATADDGRPALVASRAGCVGIGTASPSAAIHLGNREMPRSIVLHDRNALLPNDHEFRGLSVTDTDLVYRVDGPDRNHVFAAGASAQSSRALLTLHGTGAVDLGEGVELQVAGSPLILADRSIDLRPDRVHGLFVAASDGAVGLGTDVPLAPLDVRSFPLHLEGVAELHPEGNTYYAACNVFASPSVFEEDVLVRSNLTIEGALNATRINYTFSNVTVYSSQEVRSNLIVTGSTTVTEGLRTGAPVVPAEGSNVTLGTDALPFEGVYLRSNATVNIGTAQITCDDQAGTVTFGTRAGGLLRLVFDGDDLTRLLDERLRMLTETFFSPLFLSTPSRGASELADIVMRFDGDTGASGQWTPVLSLSNHVMLYDHVPGVTQYAQTVGYGMEAVPAREGFFKLDPSGLLSVASTDLIEYDVASNSAISVSRSGSLRFALSNPTFSTRVADRASSYEFTWTAYPDAYWVAETANAGRFEAPVSDAGPSFLLDARTYAGFYDSNVIISVVSVEPQELPVQLTVSEGQVTVLPADSVDWVGWDNTTGGTLTLGISNSRQATPVLDTWSLQFSVTRNPGSGVQT